LYHGTFSRSQIAGERAIDATMTSISVASILGGVRSPEARQRAVSASAVNF